MRGLPDSEFPSLSKTISLNLAAAQLTNPNAKIVGISVNTSSVDVEQGREICAQLGEEHGLPCVDPLRDGINAIVANLN